ncbi:transposase, partial [Acidipropionibacterium jensenii]|uniref:transposase n=1 Tax=Acidipropionibacterium jensenii TaxID=1749 RepID=UPI00214C022C
LRDECLNINSFYSLLHAQVVIGDWKTEYNHQRRHSSLGYLPPSRGGGYPSITAPWSPSRRECRRR